MRNSKLYSILERFDKYEQNRARKYLQSPFFNRNNNLIQLYEYLIKDINKRNGNPNGQKELCKEAIWKFIESPKPYNDVRFRKYSSDLLKHIENYLAQIEFEEQKLLQSTLVMKAVGNRKMDKLYNNVLKNAKKHSNDQPYRSSNHYYDLYQIESKYYDLMQYDFKRTEKSNVDEIVSHLDHFYLSVKLRFYCSVLTRQSYNSFEYNIPFIEEVLDIVAKYQFEEIPPVAVYYQVFLILTNSDEKHYFKFKELLEKYSLVFPPKEGYSIYTYALNYCIRKINQGSRTFLNEYFSLYKACIETKIIFANGGLSPWDFQNIVVAALRLGNYEWTENFIQVNKDKLDGSFRDNAVTYALAQVYFYQKKHDKVIKLLQEVEYEDVSYNLRSKAMLLATYYETDELEPLYSLFQSFRAYLNRHKDIPSSRRKSYSDLIRFTKKITNLPPGDKKGIEKLKNEISLNKDVASKGWLIEKIAELE